MGPLVTSSWLAETLQHGVEPGSLAILDVRWAATGPSAAERFRQGHVPRARLVDLDPDLPSPRAPPDRRHPLPDPARLAAPPPALRPGPAHPPRAYSTRPGPPPAYPPGP